VQERLRQLEQLQLQARVELQRLRLLCEFGHPRQCLQPLKGRCRARQQTCEPVVLRKLDRSWLALLSAQLLQAQLLLVLQQLEEPSKQGLQLELRLQVLQLREQVRALRQLARERPQVQRLKLRFR
jgi:hypothetical protein